jgi:hypothetical protein
MTAKCCSFKSNSPSSLASTFTLHRENFSKLFRQAMEHQDHRLYSAQSRLGCGFCLRFCLGIYSGTKDELSGWDGQKRNNYSAFLTTVSFACTTSWENRLSFRLARSVKASFRLQWNTRSSFDHAADTCSLCGHFVGRQRSHHRCTDLGYRTSCSHRKLSTGFCDKL